MFAASSLVLTATDQSTYSSGNSAARVSTSERLGFIEALDGASIKPAENRLSVSFSSMQRIGSLPSEEISQSFATHDAAAKSSSYSEAPTDLLTRVNWSKMPSALENLREALGSLRSVLKHSMTPGSAAPDVETIFGQFTKAVSEFDLESGATLLTTLNSDQLTFPGLESRDWSLSYSSGETDHAAAFNLLNLIASTLRKAKSLSPVVEEGSGSVLSSKPGNSKKTPGSAAPDVETIFGQSTKAVSEFDLESGATLLTTLNSDQLAFPGLESRDWSLSHSSGETDHAAAFNLLNLIASTLRKAKSLSPVVEEGSGSVLSSKPGNSKKTPGSAAPDVETIFGQFTKAVSEFDLEPGATFLTTLNSDQLAFPGLESRDWSLSHSSGETDRAAAFNLFNLIASTLRKAKSLSPVVEEGSGSVLSSKPGNSKKTPSPNTNFSSADAFQAAGNSSEQFLSGVASQKAGVVDVFNRADAPMVSVKEAPKGQTVSYVAQFKSTLPSVLGMANDKPVKGQDMATGTRVTLTSSGNREGVSGGLTPTEGNTDRPTLLNAQGSRSLWSSLAQGEHPLENKHTGDFAVTKPKPEIFSGMAQERVSKAQDLAARDQTLLTSNSNRTTEKTDAQRNALEVNQSSISEPVARLDRVLQADAPINRSVDRPSNRRPVNAFEAVEFDPRTKASLALAGPRSKLGEKAPFSAIFQHNQVIASPSEFGIVDLGLFLEADVSTTLELGQNGLASGLPAAEARAERPTLLTAHTSRPTGFSIALTEQMRGISSRDGVTKVQLSPRGLGTIEVEVATDVDNTTNIVIRSDNSVVLTALKDVRDLVSQVLNLDSGGTLNFEESTGNSDAQSGEDARDQELDVDVSQSGGVTSGGIARIDVIGGDVLDIMA